MAEQINQTTIKNEVTLEGVGLHTGKQVTLTFKPATADTGYVFKRVDLEGAPEIAADVSYVVDTQRGTSLEKNGVSIQTCEHVLAACVGLEIDNVLIEMNESEPPIMDGSSKFFVEALERKRQPIINPYDQITDLSSMAEDLSDQMTNPFESLGVATKAAEMQIEQTDIALANTLDLLAATGASAGGATALAQAAARSKQGVAASIEQQEKRNEELRAQGEAALEANKLAEQRRLQGIQLAEGQRIQQSTAAGRAFVFGEKERRETEQLNRKQAQITGQQQVAAQARADAANIMGAGITSAAGIASSYAKAAYNPRNTTPNLSQITEQALLDDEAAELADMQQDIIDYQLNN